MSKDLFEKLLQGTKELPLHTTETPRLERGIDQISNELGTLSVKYNSQDAIGKRFLADSGINTIALNSNLKNLETRFTFEKKEIIKNTNAYLNQVQETNVNDIIDKSRKNTKDAFLENMNSALHSNWQKSKLKILEDWDIQQDNKLFERKTKKMDMIKNQVLQYSTVMKELNASRLLMEKINLLDKLSHLSAQIECTTAQKKSMQEAWDILSNLTHIEYNHAKKLNDIQLVRMKRALIQSSKTWLEKQYLLMVEKYLFENAQKLRMGGSPSLMHRLHHYVLLRYKNIGSSSWLYPNLEIKDNTPIWLFLYIMIRSGLWDLALKYVQDNPQNFFSVPEFSSCFEEYVTSSNHRLSEKNRVLMFDRYRMIEYVTNEDPFKVLIYKMIGRCHLHIQCNPDIINTIEDYIWYQLNLVSEPIYGEQREFESYRLIELQNAINQTDSSEFDKNGLNPWFYFNILLLTCQYERAIDYLYKHESFRLEAVHFSIAFAYYGLIQIPQEYDNSVGLLVIDMDQTARLNYCRLLNQYIELFVGFESMDAFEYLCLLTLCPSKQTKEMCCEKMCDFIVGFSDYKQLLGDKHLTQGKLVKYKTLIGIDESEIKSKIVSPVAERLKYEDRHEDAAFVYKVSSDTLC